ncbi:hypothetical protein [Rhizobacter sp. OV335]|jgi:hypothetical protein|uniref:hypothetical protein n=1 Tax=Rhizobacter sp. OV335 TaxID=1500264 RepID=UPI00090EBED8|nr:hypothetical protein [Rhizobacter sp. OV335]SHM62216.1 hypothetical protein SAMN02787076_01739 [Rhizobacter sp. OV335]
MIEKLLHVGAPSPLRVTGTLGGGTGTVCSRGVEAVTLGTVNYKHLPFVQNGINSVDAGGDDVVSYNFSGCIMAVYKVGGVFKVCHVSTGDGQDCKAEWERIKGTASAVFEFKPADFVDTGGAALKGVYGLITADLQTYAITVVHNTAAGGDAKIAAIKKAHLLR